MSARRESGVRVVFRVGVMVPVVGLLLLLVTTIAAAELTDSGPRVAAPKQEAAVDVPAFAYYYIWFDPTSWNRAKTDLPLAGKYSSDERSVMEEHVVAAKAAGLEGFIVSWKHTDKLDRRLETLIDIAEQHDFKLIVIYQGLDFARDPLPAPKVASDLRYFRDNYASRTPFQVFEKPAVIISGSWEFSRDEMALIGGDVRQDLLVLGSEKDVEGIQRLDGLIDGNAYYWSSVNPQTQRKYQERLDAMAAAVHETNGVWIPPAAVGFDARLVGGTSTVERYDGETLKREMAVALASSPDALGVISWNEFSENSHIEPSRKYGTLYLEVLADLLGGERPSVSVGGADVFDSSDTGSRGSGFPQAVAIGGVFLMVLAFGLVLRGRRRRTLEGGGTPSNHDHDPFADSGAAPVPEDPAG